MPLWTIFHGPEAFSKPAEKAAVAKGATDFYVSRGIPDFYITVLFVPVPTESLFNAAKPQFGHVLVEIFHVARNIDPNNHTLHTKLKDAFDGILGPYTTAKGLHLEYAVLDAVPYLSRINGVDLPESFGPEEKEKAEKARALLEAQHRL